MAINLHEKYAKEIQTKFVKESIVAGLLSNEYSWAGVKTVKISTPQTVPMVDYTRSGSNRYGTPTEMQDIIQELTLTQDKSFALTIDKGNNEDQQGIKAAGRMLGLQIKEQAVPTMDKYVLKTLANKAGKIAFTSTALTKTTVTEAIDAGVNYLDDAEVPDSDRALLISTAAFQLLKNKGIDLHNESITADAFKKGQVGMYSGMPIIKMPAGRCPAGVDFIIVYKNSATAPVKLNDTKIHIDPPGISGNLLEGRQYYDCFVFAQKADGIYAHVTTSADVTVVAAPSAAEGTSGDAGKIVVTGTTDGATYVYTLDGTDPRYSPTAQTYTAGIPFTEKTTIKVYGKKEGSYPSAVTTATITPAS